MDSPAASPDHANADEERFNSSSPSIRMVSWTTFAPMATRSATCFFSILLVSEGEGSRLSVGLIFLPVTQALPAKIEADYDDSGNRGPTILQSV
jgi:hypothetical protein